jgi:hypothetical protein
MHVCIRVPMFPPASFHRAAHTIPCQLSTAPHPTQHTPTLTQHVGWLPQLLNRVGEEADDAPACAALLAQLRAVARGMEPALKHPVGKGAVVTSLAGALQVRVCVYLHICMDMWLWELVGVLG